MLSRGEMVELTQINLDELIWLPAFGWMRTRLRVRVSFAMTKANARTKLPRRLIGFCARFEPVFLGFFQRGRRVGARLAQLRGLLGILCIDFR